jgi:hypothetical protein
MVLDFIKIPYTTQPSMSRNLGCIFNSDPDPTIIEEKRSELEKYKEDLHFVTHESTINQLIPKAAKICGKQETNNIIEFALNFEEDVAILHKGILAAICFCFPSSWVPSSRTGFALADIHKEVADGQRLAQMSDRLTKIMSTESLGSFRRSVWTVTANPNRSNHPNNKILQEPRSIDDLYFRLETQTTRSLEDEFSSLFFVKVDVQPLAAVWEENRDKIKDSINSMSDNVLKYKNLEQIKTLLNNIE